MTRWLVRTLSASVLSLLMLGPRSASGDDPKVIRIGTPGVGVGNTGFVGGTPFAALHGLGILEAELERDGIKIEWAFFKGAGPAVNEAAANGHLDVWALGDLPAIVARAGGFKTKVLLASTTRANTYVAVPPDSPITRVEDLRGKRLALTKGTATHLAASRFLAAHGLSERDVRVVSMDGHAGRAALTTRSVDALAGGLELISLRDRGIARLIYSTRDESPELQYQSTLNTTEEFARRYPHIVQRVVNAWVRAAHWVSRRERAEVFALWAKSGTPLETWQQEFGGVDLRVKVSPLLDDYVVGRYRAGIEEAKRLGFIRATFDVEQWFDRRFLDAALKAEGLQGYWSECDAGGSPRRKHAKS